MTAPAEDPRGGIGPFVCGTCLGRGGSCGTCRGTGQVWSYVAKPYFPPAAGRGGTDSGEEEIKPGFSAESNGRRLKWFTDAELAAELARRRALDGT